MAFSGAECRGCWEVRQHVDVYARRSFEEHLCVGQRCRIPMRLTSHTVVVELCRPASRGAWCRRRLLLFFFCLFSFFFKSVKGQIFPRLKFCIVFVAVGHFGPPTESANGAAGGPELHLEFGKKRQDLAKRQNNFKSDQKAKITSQCCDRRNRSICLYHLFYTPAPLYYSHVTKKRSFSPFLFFLLVSFSLVSWISPQTLEDYEMSLIH